MQLIPSTITKSFLMVSARNGRYLIEVFVEFSLLFSLEYP